MKKLSDREQEVFDFIIEYKTSNDGNSPTIREIMRATSCTSTSVVNYYLNRLHYDYGLITRPRENRQRSITVIGGKWTYEKDNDIH